jgi:hypothetical protein
MRIERVDESEKRNYDIMIRERKKEREREREEER